MCLIAWSIGADASHPLRLAANRDEFFERPTEPLHSWTLPDGTVVVGGRDLRDGGTWLGMNAAGRVAMLTNVRSAHPGPGRTSRGALTTRWLSQLTSLQDLLAGINPADYGGFNLVVGDVVTGQWTWITNRHPDRPHDDSAPELHHRMLVPGLYGLSNAALDTPWPKTERLKAALAASLQDRGPFDAPLAAALADSTRQSPESLPSTGVPREVEWALSSSFVDMGERGYGTRSSLLLDVTRGPDGWRSHWQEWTHRPPAPQTPHCWSPTAPRTLHWP